MTIHWIEWYNNQQLIYTPNKSIHIQIYTQSHLYNSRTQFHTWKMLNVIEKPNWTETDNQKDEPHTESLVPFVWHLHSCTHKTFTGQQHNEKPCHRRCSTSETRPHIKPNHLKLRHSQARWESRDADKTEQKTLTSTRANTLQRICCSRLCVALFVCAPDVCVCMRTQYYINTTLDTCTHTHQPSVIIISACIEFGKLVLWPLQTLCGIFSGAQYNSEHVLYTYIDYPNY